MHADIERGLSTQQAIQTEMSMHGDHLPAITCASTERVRVQDRLAYRDDYNASALQGLRTSSLVGNGLMARQMNVALRRDLYLAEIAGNGHVIERNPRLVRRFPKEPVFACHLMKGRGYFIQKGKILAVRACDTIIYDARQPFTYGFVPDMRQFVIDIPAAIPKEGWGIDIDALPVKIEPANPFETALSFELRRTLVAFLGAPSIEGAACLPGQTHTVIRALAGAALHGAARLDRSVSTCWRPGNTSPRICAMPT